MRLTPRNSAPAGYVEATNIWLFFAITGLNAYTLAGYALLVAVMVPCIIAAPLHAVARHRRLFLESPTSVTLPPPPKP